MRRLALVAICVLGLFTSCTDISQLSSPPGRGPRIGIIPRYSLVSGAYMGDPINRIRLTARNKATNEIVGTLVTDVNPANDNWDLSLDVSISDQVEVVVTIELVNVTAG